MSQISLYGKVIVVAGGSGGIGAEVCKLLASKGAQVIIACRASSYLIQLISDLGKSNLKFVFVEKDLTKLDEWESLMGIVLQKFGKIDLLINSVGMITSGRFIDLSQLEIQNYINTNFLSIIYGCKSAVQKMLKQNFGHIIVVGSLGGIIPMPYKNIYSATKFGVRGFCLSLAEELRTSGIILSLISPGPVKTKMLDFEASDDKATLAFAINAFSPKQVALNILKVIQHPKREVVLPHYIKFLSIIVGLSPKLFEIIFPLLSRVGKSKMKKYQYKYSLNSN